ncbi:MAG: hypothetical protein QXO92_01445, partial [Candidatus Bathyarchaeia archaeon]
IASDEPIILVSEEAFETSKAFVSYTPWALVDGNNVTDAIKTAILPAFLPALPILVPEGLYITGIVSEIDGRPSRNRLVFAHQVSVPRFNESISHDPTIGLFAELATTNLPMLTWNLFHTTVLLAGAAATLASIAAYLLASRRK